MANLIVITGPQAVGKMTVAEKIKEQSGYSLMTNHDSIELSIKIFENGTKEQKELNELIRKTVFNTAIKNNNSLIFTFVTAFNSKEDIDYLNKLRLMFEKSGGQFYLVELKADVKTRLERNITPHRLKSKQSKNNIEWSNNELIESMKKYRLNSNDDEYICQNHIKIDNTNLSPEEVANIVIEKFNLISIKKTNQAKK